MAAFAGQSHMVKTSLRTGFTNMPPACWIEMGSNPPSWSSPEKRHHLAVMPFFWWGKVDSNHRSYKQQIYSLSPLATREFPPIYFAFVWSR